MADMPNYGKPPLIEVAVGVQFPRMQELCAAHIGAYWATINEHFSKVQDQSPIRYMVESFATKPRPPQFYMSDKPEIPRTWFIDKSETQLIQLQRDHFIFNWRKAKENDKYPRFPNVTKRFFQYWQGFCEFLAEHDLPAPQVDQCELTYVNHIRQGEGWNDLTDLNRLFTVFNWQTRTDFLPLPEGFKWSLRFLLPEKKGRLHVDALPVLLPSGNVPAIRFSLTARGIPGNEVNLETIDGWFTMAREWIVKGFADLVSEETDVRWERKA